VPTYQYACTECDHRFEAVQSFSDSALSECPQCSGRLRKLYGAVGVVFKGSGFYRTDSRASSSAPAAPAPAAAKSDSPAPAAKKESSGSSSSSSAPAAAAS
jgi:putative FmdB family regulatory protein